MRSGENEWQEVLIADDEPNIVTALEFLLERNGYEVYIARNGDAALKLVEEHRPDLVLLDVMMPVKSGFEVCQRMRERADWRAIKIIMLTAKGRDVEMSKGLSIGADLYLTKPFSTQERCKNKRTAGSRHDISRMRARSSLVVGLARFRRRARHRAALAAMVAAGNACRDQAVLSRMLEERAPMLGFIGALCSGCGRIELAVQNAMYGAARAPEQTRVVLANPNTGRRWHARAECARRPKSIAGRRLSQRAQRHGSEDRRLRLAAGRGAQPARGADVGLVTGRLLCNAKSHPALNRAGARAAQPAAAPIAWERLGCSALLDREEIAHALDKLQYALRPGRRIAEHSVPSPRWRRARLVRVQMALFLAAGGRVGGVVLALEDVTRFVGQELQRRQLLQALAGDARAPVANIRATAENMVGFPEMEATQRQRFVQIIAEESQALSRTIDAALSEYADAIKASMALEDMRAADLITVARPRIGALPRAQADEVDDNLWLRVDSFALVQSLSYLAWRLREELAVDAVRLRIRARKGFAELDLVWTGRAVRATTSLWESQPMQWGSEQTPLTLRTCLSAWRRNMAPAG